MSDSQGSSTPQMWLDGGFTPVNRAAVSPLDRGFMYGDGVFETMRAQDGDVLYLDEHLERARLSLQPLRIRAELPSRVDEILNELLARNGLTTTTAVVKLIVTRGVAPGLGLPESARPTVCLTAFPYSPPAPSIYQTGWSIEVFREGFAPPLAAHKTMNYLYFLIARQAATEAGADEAVILDPAGRVTETSAGSIIARSSGTWWTPGSPHQLPGITVRKLAGLLNETGLEVERRLATPEDLLGAETVWITSSLMGIMPVRIVEGYPVGRVAADEAAALRDRLFAQGRPGRPREKSRP